ncbi:MAG TPA: formate dehydrogenase [Ramlibacter sp.]|nr:formate dehydrogenase [Ramlibacter sp.]
MSKSDSKLSRRSLFGGAATTGALAAAATLLPKAPLPGAEAAQPKEPPARGGGYHVSEHVQHYYKTTRL